MERKRAICIYRREVKTVPLQQPHNPTKFYMTCSVPESIIFATSFLAHNAIYTMISIFFKVDR